MYPCDDQRASLTGIPYKKAIYLIFKDGGLSLSWHPQNRLAFCPVSPKDTSVTASLALGSQVHAIMSGFLKNVASEKQRYVLTPA